MKRDCEIGFRGIAYLENEWRKVTILSDGDKLDVRSYGDSCPCEICIEGDDLYLIPGAIDIHVHVRDWQLSYKETIESATRAALKGGIIAIADMPNTQPEVNSEELVMKRIEDFTKRSYTDFAIYSGVPSNEEEVRRIAKLPILGFKVYPKDYPRAKALKNTNAFVIVHPEDPIYVKESPVPGDRDFTRNPYAEISAIELFKDFPRVHFTHVTLPESVDKLRKLGSTFDSTPHHLLLSSTDERIKGCLAKVNPPLRDYRKVRKLREAFRSNPWIVATDHAPHALWEKKLSFTECPPGIASLDISLPLIASKFSLEHAIKAYSELPAKLLGLWPKLGVIRKGAQASFTILRKESSVVNCETFESKAKFGPYCGFALKYTVYATVIRGSLRYYYGSFMKKDVSNLPGYS
ncbi:dihydroorotase [Ignicoccus islandicus DSM 13165]|uniref:Dihydroorotase n=1 Tax=Ignicoccus islandicus DSM 13165 TaxID=940295 RepID=A0A0U3E0D3_9CREN|nr:dihydroorotase [Ignicoccus islandicus]ALU11371.1 dihydroorotase [Ignicoccus islandicus DSM 13165]